jgi:hypothetical protein
VKPKIGDYWYKILGMKRILVHITDIQERDIVTIEEYEAQEYYDITYKNMFWDTISTVHIKYFVDCFIHIGQKKELETFLDEEIIRDIIE